MEELSFRINAVFPFEKRRDEVRYATWTMVSITTTYLCCSSLSLFISVMGAEHIFPNSTLLYNEDHSSTRFYTLATDVVSILVAVNSLLRLPVYMLCSPNLREQLLKEFPMLNWCSVERKKLESADEKYSPYQPALLGRPTML
ncbi:hypothetical protein COOONC_22307 [Cooperia oncophora]